MGKLITQIYFSRLLIIETTINNQINQSNKQQSNAYSAGTSRPQTPLINNPPQAPLINNPPRALLFNHPLLGIQ